MNAPLPPPALEAIRAHEAEMVEIRHQIHANPELAYEEHATSDLVAERLARWGWEVHRGLGGTGVVGTLRAGSSTRRIGLRADMDALPIAETSGKPCRSFACRRRFLDWLHEPRSRSACFCGGTGRRPRAARHPRR